MTSEELQLELHRLASEAARLAEEMDFRLLYNRRRNLLSVGYDVPARGCTPPATICWPPKLGPPHSLRSRRETFLKNRGST